MSEAKTYDIKFYEPIVNRYAEMRARKRVMSLDASEQQWIQLLSAKVDRLTNDMQDVQRNIQELMRGLDHMRAELNVMQSGNNPAPLPRGRWGSPPDNEGAHDEDRMTNEGGPVPPEEEIGNV